jgi:hypothetical protein
MLLAGWQHAALAERTGLSSMLVHVQVRGTDLDLVHRLGFWRPEAKVSGCGAGQLLRDWVVCQALDGVIVGVLEDALCSAGPDDDGLIRTARRKARAIAGVRYAVHNILHGQRKGSIRPAALPASILVSRSRVLAFDCINPQLLRQVFMDVMQYCWGTSTRRWWLLHLIMLHTPCGP